MTILAKESERGVQSVPIEQLIDRMERWENYSIAELGPYLKSLEIDEAWIDAHMPDPMPTDAYHRNLIYQGRRFEVVLATWPIGGGTLVHDHGSLSSLGAVRVLRGDIFNQVYRLVDRDTVKPVHREVFHTNDIVPVDHGLIHAMGNACQSVIAMSLHVYFPWIIDVSYWDPETNKRIPTRL